VLNFKVVPLQPSEVAEPVGSAALEAVLDTSAVELLPDKEALLPLILDQSIDQETERMVMVKTTTGLLAGSGPQDAVALVVIEFRGNVNVTLEANLLQQQVAVPVPLIDVLLNRDTEGVYRYRQTVVYQQGGRTQTGDWRESDLGVLIVPQA
jgi:hypothetical protein